MARERRLAAHELDRLSPGLAQALERAGIAPRVVCGPHPAARVAGLWRGGVPILARPGRIFWPGAADDIGALGERAVAVLQHELQHLLDYAAGELSAARYLTNPRNWTYRYRLTEASRWSDFGAEQRASIAEHYWLLGRGRADLVERDLRGPCARRPVYQAVIPWA